MRNAKIPNETRKRLLRAGFGRAYANRTAREIQDHWDEIIQSLMAAGQPLEQAEAEAAKRIGSPGNIADEIAARMRASSWLGRFPTLGFAVLAVTLTIAWWVSLGSIAAHFCGVFRDVPQIGPRLPLKIGLLDSCFDWIRSLSYVVLPWLCCLVAERFWCGWRPALWACLVLSTHNAMHFLRVSGSEEHGNVAWGYSFNFGTMPGLLAIVAPIAVFGLWRIWNLRDEFHSHDSNSTFC